MTNIEAGQIIANTFIIVICLIIFVVAVTTIFIGKFRKKCAKISELERAREWNRWSNAGGNFKGVTGVTGRSNKLNKP